jgi:hypothetical protein
MDKKDDTMTTNDNNDKVFTCFDNGSGMSKDILVDVLLCLGGSAKGEHSIGGFGYAKTLLFFAHKAYTIQTKNWIVQGTGGTYTITENPEFVKGAFIEIVFDGTEVNQSQYRFNDTFNTLLEYSNLPNIRFSYNDVSMKTRNLKMDYQYPTDIGLLQFSDNPGGSYSELFVRVNGLVMFSNIIFSSTNHFIGFIDLDKPSTEILTSNRDSLKGAYRQDINKIINTLSSERSSLQSRELVNMTLNSFDISKAEENSHKEIQESVQKFQDTQQRNEQKESERPHMDPANVFGVKDKIHQRIQQQERTLQEINEFHFPHNFKIKQTESVKITMGNIRKDMNSQYATKMSHIWRNAVYLTLKSMSNFLFYDIHGNVADFHGQEGTFYLNNRPIFVGFCYDSTRALNYQNKDEIQILINFRYLKKLRKEQRLTVNKIFDLVFHEITHIFIGEHGDSFSSEEMDIRWGFEDYYNPVSFKQIDGIKLI